MSALKQSFAVTAMVGLSVLSVDAQGENTFDPKNVVTATHQIGDYSGSRSERWEQIVSGAPVNIRPQSSQFGQVDTLIINQYRLGQAYTLSMGHIGTDPAYTGTPRPDFDYTSTVTFDRASILIDDNDPPLLGYSSGNETNEAAGKTVQFGFPKPVLEFMDYTEAEAQGQPGVLIIVNENDSNEDDEIDKDAPFANDPDYVEILLKTELEGMALDEGNVRFSANTSDLRVWDPDDWSTPLSLPTTWDLAEEEGAPFRANGKRLFLEALAPSTAHKDVTLSLDYLNNGTTSAEAEATLLKVDLDIVHPATGELDEAKEDTVGGYVAKEHRTGIQTKLRIHPVDIDGASFRLKFDSGQKYRLLKEDDSEIASESTVFPADEVSDIIIEGNEYSEQGTQEEVILQLVLPGGQVVDGDSVRFSVVPAQFEVFFKVFIPYQWVRILGHPLYDNSVVAKGDDRDFADDVSASARMGQVAIVIPYPDLDVNGIGSISGEEFAVSWTGTTEHYNYTDLTNPLTTAAHQGLEPQTRIIEGSSPADSGVAPTDEMHILPPASRDPNTNKVTISFNGSAGEPIVIGALPIDYEIDITIDSADPLAPTFKVTGWQDGFPAYEGYARPLDLDNSSSGFTPLYQWKPELSATVLRLGATHNETLPDDVEGSININ